MCKLAQDKIMQTSSKKEQGGKANSQFDGFVPHNDVAWESEGLHVDNVNVSSFWADVKPFALKGQVAVCDSAKGDQGPSEVITGQAFHYLRTQSH